MNFLQLVNRAIVEAGSSVQPLATLANPATGEVSRFIGWVQDAWNEIQTMQSEWAWLRPWIQFPTVLQQQQYSLSYLNSNATLQFPWFNNAANTSLVTAGVTIKDQVRKSFRSWNTFTGGPDEQIVNFMDWDEFRNIYVYATQRTNYARPVIGTIAPDKAIWFGPIPDAGVSSQGYTISLEVWLDNQILLVDTDTPLMPVRFHMAIVWKALDYYSTFESAPEVMTRAEKSFSKIYGKLIQDQLPIIYCGPPLATDSRP
jgi:hypothetical protein